MVYLVFWPRRATCLAPDSGSWSVRYSSSRMMLSSDNTSWSHSMLNITSWSHSMLTSISYGVTAYLVVYILTVYNNLEMMHLWQVLGGPWKQPWLGPEWDSGAIYSVSWIFPVLPRGLPCTPLFSIYLYVLSRWQTKTASLLCCRSRSVHVYGHVHLKGCWDSLLSLCSHSAATTTFFRWTKIKLTS